MWIVQIDGFFQTCAEVETVDVAVEGEVHVEYHGGAVRSLKDLEFFSIGGVPLEAELTVADFVIVVFQNAEVAEILIEFSADVHDLQFGGQIVFHPAVVVGELVDLVLPESQCQPVGLALDQGSPVGAGNLPAVYADGCRRNQVVDVAADLRSATYLRFGHQADRSAAKHFLLRPVRCLRIVFGHLCALFAGRDGDGAVAVDALVVQAVTHAADAGGIVALDGAQGFRLRIEALYNADVVRQLRILLDTQENDVARDGLVKTVRPLLPDVLSPFLEQHSPAIAGGAIRNLRFWNPCIVQTEGNEHCTPGFVGHPVPSAVAGISMACSIVVFKEITVTLTIADLALCHCKQILPVIACQIQISNHLTPVAFVLYICRNVGLRLIAAICMCMLREFADQHTFGLVTFVRMDVGLALLLATGQHLLRFVALLCVDVILVFLQWADEAIYGLIALVGVRMPLCFLQCAGQTLLKLIALIGMGVLLHAAARGLFQCNCRKHQSIGGTEDHNYTQYADDSAPGFYSLFAGSPPIRLTRICIHEKLHLSISNK